MKLPKSTIEKWLKEEELTPNFIPAYAHGPGPRKVESHKRYLARIKLEKSK